MKLCRPSAGATGRTHCKERILLASQCRMSGRLWPPRQGTVVAQSTAIGSGTPLLSRDTSRDLPTECEGKSLDDSASAVGAAQGAAWKTRAWLCKDGEEGHRQGLRSVSWQRPQDRAGEVKDRQALGGGCGVLA